jgi:hypothetical protein
MSTIPFPRQRRCEYVPLGQRESCGADTFNGARACDAHCTVWRLQLGRERHRRLAEKRKSALSSA